MWQRCARERERKKVGKRERGEREEGRVGEIRGERGEEK